MSSSLVNGKIKSTFNLFTGGKWVNIWVSGLKCVKLWLKQLVEQCIIIQQNIDCEYW